MSSVGQNIINVAEPTSAAETKALREKQREFTLFYQGHYKMGYRYIRSRGIRDSDIEDILGRCFEIAWERFEQYLEKDRPPYWFFGILQNKSGYERRVYSQSSRLTVDGPELINQFADGRDHPETLQIAREKHQRFRAALDDLPDKYLPVVQMRLEDFSYKEISAALTISLEAAYSRMRRALILLREPFQEYLEEFED